MKLNTKFISTNKRRFDRGRVYYSYLTAFITGVIVHVLDTYHVWWIYVVVGLITFALIYIMGYFDEKWGILSIEQEQYIKLNPFYTRLQERLDLLLEKLENLEKNGKAT